MNSIARIGKLLWIELEVKGKLILIISAAAVALTIYLNFGDSNPNSFVSNSQDPLSFIRPGGTMQKFHFNWFPTFLYGLGLSITSLMFYEYRGGKSRNYHLTIPASTGEKWWSKIIAYVLLSNLLIILIYQVIAVIINRVELSEGHIYVELGFFDPFLWKGVKGYLFVQALFIVGAAFSQRFSLFKTGILLFIINFLCTWVTKISASSIVESIKTSTVTGFIPKSTLYNNLSQAGWNYSGPDSITSPFSHPDGLSWWIVIVAVVMLYAFSFMRFKELES